MAPTRESLNASYDLEAQIREYQRYEQELEDRILASNMQREYDERRNHPAPVVHPIPQQGPIVPRERTPPTNRASVDNADEIPPPSPILAGAPRIQRRLNEENNGGIFGRDSDDGSESSDNESDSSDDDVVVLPTSSNHPTNSRNDDSSSSSSSGDSSSSVRTTRSSNRSVVIHSNSGNPITVSSISTVSSNASGPSRQALVDNDDQMYQQEYQLEVARADRNFSDSLIGSPYDLANLDEIPEPLEALAPNPPHSPPRRRRHRAERNNIGNRLRPEDRPMYNRELQVHHRDVPAVPPPNIPTYKGKPIKPDARWGVCTICSEPPIKPQGCQKCLQFLGCADCIRRWYQSRQDAFEPPYCPLCRGPWGDRAPAVALMPTIMKNKQKRDQQSTSEPSTSGPSTSAGPSTSEGPSTSTTSSQGRPSTSGSSSTRPSTSTAVPSTSRRGRPSRRRN